MQDAYIRSLKQYLWFILAGTKGGLTRIRIIQLLRNRPYNTNQIHEILKLDYKTIQHHLKILLEKNIISAQKEKRYGSMYFISPTLEDNMNLFEDILAKIGENKIKEKEKR